MNYLTYLISIIFVENIYGFFHTNTGYYNFPKYMYNTIPYQRTMNEPRNEDVYDFIIIGSGSSGSVLANRLSEVTTWKILLLEAGYPANILNKIPIFAPIFAATKYSWNYTTERQEGICEGMVGKVCPWPRGKALGGSTILNYMIYTRGNPIDYRRWSEMNEGWSYEEVLPYFLKSENCQLESSTCSNGFHRTYGYLNVERPFSSAITDAFIEAGKEMGFDKVDYNSNKFMGFSKMQANMKKGRRHSVADAFLLPIEFRKNLRVLTGARVTKLLINPNTKETYGVQYDKRGRTFIARAKMEVILSAGTFNSPQLLMLSGARVTKLLMNPNTKKTYGVQYDKNGRTFIARAIMEVILSAGTFNSPQLLMLSGIGPSNDLKELGIQPLVDLPVGQTMYDHLSFIGLTFKMNQTIEPKTAIMDPNELFKFLLKGEGIYTSLGGVEGLAYVKTNVSKDSENYPDIELILSGIGSLNSDYGIISVPLLGISRDVYEKTYRAIENTPTWGILPMLLHPKSKGYLKLRSKNPYDSPELYSNFFTDPEGHDLKTMISGIRLSIELSKTKAFQRLGSTIHDIPLPGCENLTFNTDAYWECALRSIAATLHHQVGTCKMGRKDDPEAVVDNKGRVHGLRKLRVIDSSIFPVTLSAHTSAPAMMLGEKLSDEIKKQYKELS